MLHGTPTENTAALTVIGRVLDLVTVSRPYPDRPPSTLHRVYITATTKGANQ
jgi:hypothetical protein